MRALLETSVPVPRFEVDRALDAADLGTPEGRDDALRVVAPVVTRLDPGPLQYDLIQRIANRLQMPEAMTQEALRSVPRENGRDRSGLPAAPPPRRAATSSDRREDTEREFLALCLAVTQPGRRALEGMDIDAMFSGELTRRAAHYLVAHLEHPGQSLPPDDEALAKLVAQLVILSGKFPADPAALEIERLQLDKNRLDRAIADAQRAGEPVAALAAERQRVHDQIRHRLV
jgi:DNA primase